MLSGRVPLVWAHAEVICDSPEKRRVEKGEVAGRLMHRPVANGRRVRGSVLGRSPRPSAQENWRAARGDRPMMRQVTISGSAPGTNAP